MFEQQTGERRASLTEQIASAAQKNGDSVASFISHVEELQRRLRDGHAETVSDSMVMGINLKGVSTRIDATVEALRCSDSLKLETVKSKLIATDERLRSSDHDSIELCGHMCIAVSNDLSLERMIRRMGSAAHMKTS